MTPPSRVCVALYNAMRAWLGVYMPRLTDKKLDDFAAHVARELEEAGFAIVELPRCEHGIAQRAGREDCSECFDTRPIPGTLCDVFTRNPECVHGFRTDADCPVCSTRAPLGGL